MRHMQNLIFDLYYLSIMLEIMLRLPTNWLDSYPTKDDTKKPYVDHILCDTACPVPVIINVWHKTLM